MRHSVRARFLQTLVCAGCALALALPPPALAAGGSPVHVDPASPVAKEYALPLATARGAPPESGQSGKLFGAGIKHTSTVPTHTATTPIAAPPPASTQSEQTITPPVPPTTTTTTAPPRRHRHRRPHRPVHVTTVTLPVLTTPTTASRQITAHATPAAYRVLRPGAGSGLLWMVLAAVLVLAIGSIGGVLLRRR